MVKISPSILSADFMNMESSIKMLEVAGADMIHCDVMDGVFVPNISFGMPMVKAIRQITKTILDVHLMITKPGHYIDAFSEAGADIITVHYEACAHLHRVLQHIRSNGKLAGVSLNPATPPEVLEYVLPYVDLILCMSVNPGFGGQNFIPNSLDKLSLISKMVSKTGYDIMIEVDGGVNTINAEQIRQAGANVLVAGNAVFSSPDPATTIKILRGDIVSV